MVGQQFKIWRAPNYDTGAIVSTDTGVLSFHADLGVASAAGDAQLRLTWEHCMYPPACTVLDVHVT